MSHSHPELSSPAPADEGRPAGDTARRARRRRPQHDRLRVRRPAADRRLRRAVPRGPPPGRRPDPPRLRVDPGPARHRRGAGAHPRPRGPHRRDAVPAARAPGHPAGRLRADPGPARRQAARAPAQGDRAPRRARGRHAARSGPFELEFVAVNHSIPDALAVAIRAGGQLVLHTGDFKMDQLPLDGRITDLRAFARLGEEGVDLFLTDSTNAETPGFTALEKSITPVIDQVFRDSQQKIVVACFASHVHRVQQILDATAAHGRKAAYVGRSMVRNMAIAQELGYLTVPPGVLIDPKDLASLPPERQVLISTGLPGRADERAEPDRPARPPHRAHRGGRHRPARLEPDPRQRERRLPGHQRPGPLGRPGRAQGQRAGARERPRQRRRAPLLLQHRRPAQRDAGARRDPAPAGQRRAGHGDRRRQRRDRRGRRGRRPRRRGRDDRRQGALRLRLRRRQRRSATSPSPTSRTAGSSARRASSR